MLAVIDIGTNTFHLLIVEKGADKSLKIIYKSEIFVKLADKDSFLISRDAFERGITSLREFQDIANMYHIKELHAFATASMRNANNSSDFINRVKNELGFNIRVITGDEEAKFIYEGVKERIHIDSNSLIMDIGGGSVEFIAAASSGINHSASYALGAALILNTYKLSDPPTENEIAIINSHIEYTLQPLTSLLADYYPNRNWQKRETVCTWW